MRTLDLLIVDDHPIVRDGLRMMLESSKDKYEFNVTEAESATDAMNHISSKSYDCIIMDYKLPDKNGDEITKDIINYNKDAKIIGLSNYDEHVYAAEMLSAGAKGYVLKNIGSNELITAIEKVMDGKLYYSADIANKLINMNMQTLEDEREGKRTEDLKGQLSKREIEIIKHIANELTNEEIAKMLELSKRTVDNHRQNILSKLNLRNTAGLVRFAVENGILED